MRMPRVGRRVLLLGSIHFVLCTGAVLDGQPAAGGAGLQKATRQEDYIKARARAEVMSDAISSRDTGDDPERQMLIGLAYQWGFGVRQDFVEATRWYQKAVENGVTMAMVLLGNLNDIGGHGLEANKEEALHWYRAAAERGDSVGQHNVGVAYLTADGVPRDYTEAVLWFRKSAEQGNVLAIEALLECYRSGHGVPKSTAQAAAVLQQWADGGNVGAQAYLGALYAAGDFGLRRDDERAVHWLRRAALQGDSHAQVALGFMYSQGRGLPKDLAEAVIWYRKSAEQWNARGQANLAVMYEEGRGVPTDKVPALMWLTLADEGGIDVRSLHFDWRRLAFTLKRRVTEAEDAQRRKLVMDWKRAHAQE